MIQDVLDVAFLVAEAIDASGSEYFIGGSVASSLQGEPRATNDIDFVVAMLGHRVRTFVERLGSDFEIDQAMLRDALSRGGSAISSRHTSISGQPSSALRHSSPERARTRSVTDEPQGAAQLNDEAVEWAGSLGSPAHSQLIVARSAGEAPARPGAEGSGMGSGCDVAQWLGQYTGNTHATRIDDLEASLRVAVSAFKMASTDSERRNKAKSVRKLAKRLLSARRHQLGARIAVARQVPGQREEVASLREQMASLEAHGVRGILTELDALDAGPE